MPSTSEKQRKFMAAVAHSPSFAKKVGVPMSVGKEFNQADKGRKFARGGEMAESKKMVGKEIAFMKKKGAPASMIKHEKAEMSAMKKGGMTKMAMGGGVMQKKGMTTAKMGKVTAGGKRPHGEHTVQSKGHTKGKMVKMAGGRAC